jgi:ubiquinone/menaquinone biosynthesis C-methylase UbiE
MDAREHWERVYSTKAADQVSWFRPHLETSLAMVERAVDSKSASIIDVGGGASSLVDDLAERCYRNITVLDISQTALDAAQHRLRETGKCIRWIQADVTLADLPLRTYDLWHDRAVFHFLTQPEQRLTYLRNVARSVKPSGHVIVGTFGPEGPGKCSGLDVVRYSAETLAREFGKSFGLVESLLELHATPFGTTQQFLYCCFRLEPGCKRSESGDRL